MTILRLIIRATLFILALIVYFIVSTTIVILCRLNFERARPLLTRVITATSIVGLKIFGVKVRKYFAPINPRDNFLIVANHLSYLDILIISAHYSTSFVTSKEMKETPFLGQLCLLGGCLFVERRSKSGITGEVAEITNALKSGLNVVIFPEATSTNGEAVIRFKRPLFQSAVNSGINVLPVCLNYRTLDGEPLTIKNRDNVFWYGDMGFLGHALNLFSHKNIVADFTVMPPMTTSEFPDKNSLADKCFELISAEYDVISHAK